MRGGAQAHLVEASDGHFYVVKFINNPQHRRILINEWLAAAVFGYLNIQVPEVAVVDLSAEFLQETPEMGIQLGARQQPVFPGWHFGSRYPGDPARMAVYDFLPDQLLDSVRNHADFVATLVADKLLGNSDSRQAIFFRAQVRDWLDSDTHPNTKAFVAQMIDHGFAFNGPHWDFPDSPLQGLYFRHSVYHSIRSLDDLEPWLSQARAMPAEVLDAAWRSMPPAWVEEETPKVCERLIETLLKRRKRLPSLLEDVRRGRVSPFANWK